MTATQLVFDPFSEEFFTDPYPTYRRMREEAPVYYSEEYDFYALTRHEDVAAAFKDYETYSSARGIELSMIKKGGVPPESKSMIFMDPPEHRRMRSLVNKVFTPRAITALKTRSPSWSSTTWHRSTPGNSTWSPTSQHCSRSN